MCRCVNDQARLNLFGIAMSSLSPTSTGNLRWSRNETNIGQIRQNVVAPRLGSEWSLGIATVGLRNRRSGTASGKNRSRRQRPKFQGCTEEAAILVDPGQVGSYLYLVSVRFLCAAFIRRDRRSIFLPVLLFFLVRLFGCLDAETLSIRNSAQVSLFPDADFLEQPSNASTASIVTSSEDCLAPDRNCV